jgi:hypothetical protein
MKRIATAGLMVLLVTVLLSAQSGLTGTWQGASPGGSKVVLEAKTADTALSGTLTVDGQKLALADGKVANKTFAFTVTLPPNGAVQAFSGEFVQDELELWMDSRGRASAAVLTRVNKK